MSLALKVENLSKAYQLGQIGTGTISRDIERWIAKKRGKEDPFLRIGETNSISGPGKSNMVWSLKDLTFDINQGDVVGIIGRNGAGKSTLLKILSRITSPTTGSVKGNGRVASLLEVGTGFNPELTGRENTFLNGAILGMRKAEIRKHFDSIVDFAGIERYIDTPVKRYSSGMYVRLAFAVAAYLESEILIVDEVLAVGDSEFQKKCLGKMGDISKKEGRTVLFVSHNMSAVRELCKTGILLNQGVMEFKGGIEATVSKYLKTGIKNGIIDQKKAEGTLVKDLQFEEVSVNGIKNQEALFDPSVSISIEVKGHCLSGLPGFRCSINIYKEGLLILTAHDVVDPEPLKKGQFISKVQIPAFILRPGEYTIAVGGHNGTTENSGYDWIYIDDTFAFSILQKWSAANDFNGKGLINIPFAGKRIQNI